MADDGNGGDNVGVVEAWELPSVAEVELTKEQIAAIKTAVAGTSGVKASRPTMWVGKAIAPVLKLDVDNDKARIKKVIKILVDEGALRVVPGRKGNRTEVLFVVCGGVQKKVRPR